MFLVPENGAKRIFLVHVHMVEPLRRHVALVFHNGAIGTLHISETCAPSGLYAIRLGIGYLRLCPAKRSFRARPAVATDPYLAALGCRVKRQQGNAIPLIRSEVLTHVHTVPAEVPDRRLGFGWSGRVDLGE